MKKRNILNLSLISLANLFGGISLSLLSPFYPGEALKKGVSVTLSGLVLSSVYITTVICTPLIGRYIDILGARKFLLVGSSVCALSNIVFGFLDFVEGSTIFLALSFIIRIVTAIGESAIPNSCMALATKQLDKGNQGKAVATCEACFGIGSIFGPSIGGLLYDYGGFSLPFFAHGSAQLLLAILCAVFLEDDRTPGYESLEEDSQVEVTWLKILAAPGVLLSSLTLCCSGIAWVWYAASLEPFLEETYAFSASSTGLVFMTLGITYTIFTPVFGFFLDRSMNGLTAMMIGTFIVAIAFSLLGPIPPLQALLGSHSWITILSVGLQGVGFAAVFLGSLIHMLKGASEAGLPDSEKVCIYYIAPNIL